ncbi:hypothetical protein, variant 1 [Fonticula alba]|uniref:BZIP domain-containing protein n=1 Tax=Fonticula alba TaxID=691883 RepID=A0A058ZFA6_FONAL|nr:hypothetical protein, variant 1 [Fonticula alba]KCV72636.1 hypothetical protein, variant 1 [Fonticula alba]|eukprot:XP_009492339.1 hypothetical protein, variant 1 [Fonticula alba]
MSSQLLDTRALEIDSGPEHESLAQPDAFGRMATLMTCDRSVLLEQDPQASILSQSELPSTGSWFLPQNSTQNAWPPRLESMRLSSQIAGPASTAACPSHQSLTDFQYLFQRTFSHPRGMSWMSAPTAPVIDMEVPCPGEAFSLIFCPPAASPSDSSTPMDSHMGEEACLSAGATGSAESTVTADDEADEASEADGPDEVAKEGQEPEHRRHSKAEEDAGRSPPERGSFPAMAKADPQQVGPGLDVALEADFASASSNCDEVQDLIKLEGGSTRIWPENPTTPPASHRLGAYESTSPPASSPALRPHTAPAATDAGRKRARFAPALKRGVPAPAPDKDDVDWWTDLDREATSSPRSTPDLTGGLGPSPEEVGQAISQALRDTGRPAGRPLALLPCDIAIFSDSVVVAGRLRIPIRRSVVATAGAAGTGPGRFFEFTTPKAADFLALYDAIGPLAQREGSLQAPSGPGSVSIARTMPLPAAKSFTARSLPELGERIRRAQVRQTKNRIAARRCRENKHLQQRNLRETVDRLRQRVRHLEQALAGCRCEGRAPGRSHGGHSA